MPAVELAAAVQADEAIHGSADFLQLEHVDGKHGGFLIAGKPDKIAAASLEQPLEADVGIHEQVVSWGGLSFQENSGSR